MIDPENIFSIYNDDRNTSIMVQNMDANEIGSCTKQLDDILLPLVTKPYRIWIDNKPDDSDFKLVQEEKNKEEDHIAEDKYRPHNDKDLATVDLSHAEEKTIVLKRSVRARKT